MLKKKKIKKKKKKKTIPVFGFWFAFFVGRAWNGGMDWKKSERERKRVHLFCCFVF